MKKRVLVALLWFYAGWYGGAVVAHFAGLPELVGPLVGLAAAAICIGDPGGFVWSPPWRRERVDTAPAVGAAQPSSSGGSPSR